MTPEQMIPAELLPGHVTVIMDGNGRWAKRRGKPRIEGHFEGVESVRAVLEKSVELGIPYLSVFAFSEENWNRSGDEVEGLMELMMRSMKAELPTFLKNGVRFRVIGNLERLSEDLRAAIAEMERLTADWMASSVMETLW